MQILYNFRFVIIIKMEEDSVLSAAEQSGLSAAQIDLAWEEIDRRHPLDKTPFFAVFPWLRCLRKFSCCRLNRQVISN